MALVKLIRGGLKDWCDRGVAWEVSKVAQSVG